MRSNIICHEFSRFVLHVRRPQHTCTRKSLRRSVLLELTVERRCLGGQFYRKGVTLFHAIDNKHDCGLLMSSNVLVSDKLLYPSNHVDYLSSGLLRQFMQKVVFFKRNFSRMMAKHDIKKRIIAPSRHHKNLLELRHVPNSLSSSFSVIIVLIFHFRLQHFMPYVSQMNYIGTMSLVHTNMPKAVSPIQAYRPPIRVHHEELESHSNLVALLKLDRILRSYSLTDKNILTL